MMQEVSARISYKYILFEDVLYCTLYFRTLPREPQLNKDLTREPKTCYH